MTVDADLTAELLKTIRDEGRATRHEIAEVRNEMRSDIATVRTDVGVLGMRLESVERVLVNVVQEQRMLTQFVKRLASRVDKLEAREQE